MWLCVQDGILEMASLLPTWVPTSGVLILAPHGVLSQQSRLLDQKGSGPSSDHSRWRQLPLQPHPSSNPVLHLTLQGLSSSCFFFLECSQQIPGLPPGPFSKRPLYTPCGTVCHCLFSLLFHIECRSFPLSQPHTSILDHRKSKRISEKNLLLLHWLR